MVEKSHKKHRKHKKRKKLRRGEYDIYRKLLKYVVGSFIRKRKKRKPAIKGESKSDSKSATTSGHKSSGLFPESIIPSIAPLASKFQHPSKTADKKDKEPSITINQPPALPAPAIPLALPAPSAPFEIKGIENSKRYAFVDTQNKNVMRSWDLDEFKEFQGELDKNKNDAKEAKELKDEVDKILAQNNVISGDLNEAIMDNKLLVISNEYKVTTMQLTFKKAQAAGLVNNTKHYSKVLKAEGIQELFNT